MQYAPRIPQEAGQTSRTGPTSPEVAANTMLTLINQCTVLLSAQIKRLEADFLAEGGFTERLYHARSEARKKGVFSFYRYHTVDPVYFHRDIKVTIQQLGAMFTKDMLEVKATKLVPVVPLYTILDNLYMLRYFEMENPPKLEDKEFSDASFLYRCDDVCATALFYLDQTSTDLPALQSIEIRNHNLEERVYNHFAEDKRGDARVD